MRSLILFQLLLLCIINTQCGYGQSITELVYNIKQKYLAEETVSAKLIVVEVKQDAVSTYDQFIYSDNRSANTRILIEPNHGRVLFYSGSEIVVIADKTQSYYIERDTLALLRFRSYLDNISAILLAREPGNKGSNRNDELIETIAVNDKGITECRIEIPDNPALGISNYFFQFDLDVENGIPVREILSYLFIGDVVSKEIILDTIYKNSKEIDSILVDINRKIETYEFYESKDEDSEIEAEPEFEINFPELQTKLQYLNYPPAVSEYYLLDFYFVQCAPCLKAIPFLKELEHDFSSDLLSIIAINDVDKKEKIEKYLAHYQITYSAAMIDKEYLVDNVGVLAHPSFVLLDKNDVILLQSSGFDAEYFEQVRNILNRK